MRKFYFLRIMFILVWAMIFYFGYIIGDKVMDNIAASQVPMIPHELSTGINVSAVGDVVDPSTVLVFEVIFNTKCKGCVSQLTFMKGIHNPPEIFVVGVNYGESDEAVQKLVNKLDLEYPIITGIEEGTLSVSSIPYTTVYVPNLDTGQWMVFDEWPGFTGGLSSKSQGALDRLHAYLEEQK